MRLRKTAFLVDETASTSTDDPGGARRVAGMAVFTNPCVGDQPAPLSAMSEMAVEVGDALMTRMLSLLDAPAVAYGKAALVGALGDTEHAAALLHPTLGRSIRGAIGGGAALIPSNGKVGALGATIDVPIGHRDEAWSFGHIDTLTIGLADAPLPNEILLVIVIAASTRANARIVSSGPPAGAPAKR
jgi:hypothetical protein